MSTSIGSTTWLKVINIAVAPLFVAIAGAFILSIRRRRKSRRRQFRMSRARFTLLLVAALAAICGAFYLSSQRNLQTDSRGASLLPTLAPELDTVTEVSIRKGSATPAVTLHKNGEQWSVAERARLSR